MRLKKDVTQTDIIRFWNSVQKNGEDNCWGWKLCSNQQGYALFTAGGRLYRAQRFAYTYSVAPIPGIQRVTSTCKNKQCCNPKHLYTATQAELLQEARERGTLSVGVMNRASKLNDDAVAHIRHTYARGDKTATYARLARKHDVSIGCIRDIIIGKTWRHL